jgi:AhpD family alkylhydroperoxidase
MKYKGFSDGKLTKVQKELIEICISVVINYESCIELHIKQSIDAGGTEEEIIEVIEVGIEMYGRPATAHARFAMNVLEYYFKK